MFDAIDHAKWQVGVDVKTHWVDAEKVEKEGAEAVIGKPDGIIVPIGWGERGAEGMIAAADYARKSKIPYLGLCYGMQLALSLTHGIFSVGKTRILRKKLRRPKHKVIHFIEAQKELIEKRAYGGTMRLGGWNADHKKGY